MRIVRKAIRKAICHPVVAGAIAVACLCATSDRWTPYIAQHLYRESEITRTTGAEENAGKGKYTHRKVTSSGSSRQKISSDENHPSGTGKKEVEEKASAIEQKAKDSKDRITQSDAFRETSENVKKTAEDTKKEVDKVRDYLKDAKEKGDPIMQECFPEDEQSKPQLIQDGIDTVTGIRNRIWGFIKSKTSNAGESSK